MPLNQLDRDQMRASQSYADYMTVAIAGIQAEMDEYRREFGEEPAQDMKDRLDMLKSDVRAEKALAARLSEQDSR